ncbi:hypothetical protein [Actinoplanes derwentensis]|uniref:SWIM-type domain-containing protein n=1 Tax=Actinoplanes derwentensis TaxID=113562 RepID=A0A1H2DB08_9ACTN|nr:hypothetical protein [Actinoplanes derwentensis]GID81752.1 hypothetical protein Ade03nite_06760 [Actinoplanes derwentensis]SDT79764.1 hypothetical protein SAMN04489716_8921 [Actinoplanes derwentensis]
MSLPVRADLLALDDAALAALANRGLVKRAAREVERESPLLSARQTTIVAGWPDGIHTELPEGGLDRGTCSCGATGVCRHLIGLVFAYQHVSTAPPSAASSSAATPSTVSQSAVAVPTAEPSVAASAAIQLAATTSDAGESSPAGSPAAEKPPARVSVSWSPGAFSDADLVGRIGARLVDAARRAERGGYTARIRRGPVPVAELPAATVRFLVPNDLGYVHTDAKAGVRDDVIALAVWAFRAADEQQPGADDCVVDVGGSRTGAATSDSGLEQVVEFAAEVLRAGAVHAGAGLAAMAAGQITALEKSSLRWPLDAVTELAGQLAAYRDRGARYSPDVLADLIAELFARHRAVIAGGGTAVRSRVLGTEEAAETPLRRVRLDGLGARVTAVDDERRVEIFHGQAASGVVLVSHRQWTATDDGPALSRRRLAGATIAALAAGTLVTESAIRSASRSVRLTASRVAKSTVTASTGAWEHLPSALRVHDYAKFAAELDAMPPRPVRARVRADLVRVLEIAEVGESHYAPGAQRLTVQIRDSLGNTATVVATHSAVAPARLDAVAAALNGTRGRPRYVAGSIHRSGGGLVIDPYAIAADGPPVVPDLASPADFPTLTVTHPAGPPAASSALPAADDGLSSGDVLPVSAPHPAAASDMALPVVEGEGRLGGSGAPGGEVCGGVEPGAASVDDGTTDVLAAVVAAAREVLAEAAHSGLAHLPPAYAERLGTARGSLAGAGLHRVASAFGELAARISPDPGIETAQAWVDAYLRVSLAADLL